MSFEEQIANLISEMSRQTAMWAETQGEILKRMERIERRLTLLEEARVEVRTDRLEELMRKAIVDKQTVNIPMDPPGNESQLLSIAKGRGLTSAEDLQRWQEEGRPYVLGTFAQIRDFMFVRNVPKDANLFLRLMCSFSLKAGEAIRPVSGTLAAALSPPILPPGQFDTKGIKHIEFSTGLTCQIEALSMRKDAFSVPVPYHEYSIVEVPLKSFPEESYDGVDVQKFGIHTLLITSLGERDLKIWSAGIVARPRL